MSRFGVSVTLVFIVSAALLGGCKETDTDKFADAQNCVDNYSRTGSGDLDKCESYVDGMNSAAAYGIRCTTGFMKEGFTDQSFLDAFSSLQTVNTSTVASFLGLVTFKAAGSGNTTNVTANYTAAHDVYGYCVESQAKGSTIIATFTYLTNLLFKYECDNSGIGTMGTCTMDSTALGKALVFGATDSTAPTISMRTELGNLILSTDEISCSNGSVNKQLCKFLDTAISNAGGKSASPDAIGLQFIGVLANPPS
jgi:hypothetical protein